MGSRNRPLFLLKLVYELNFIIRILSQGQEIARFLYVDKKDKNLYWLFSKLRFNIKVVKQLLKILMGIVKLKIA